MSHINNINSSRLRYTKGDANQNVAPAGTAVVHYTTLVFDALNEFDPLINWRFTPIRAGYYLVTASALVDLQVNNGYSINLRVSGVTVFSSFGISNAVIAGDHPVTASHILYLTPNQYIDVAVTNQGLAALTIRQNILTSLAIHRLS